MDKNNLSRELNLSDIKPEEFKTAVDRRKVIQRLDEKKFKLYDFKNGVMAEIDPKANKSTIENLNARYVDAVNYIHKQIQAK